MRSLRAPVLLVLAFTLLAGCTARTEARPGLSPSASATTPTTATGSGSTGSATTSGGEPFDCSAVSAAQQQLGEATHTALTRLGISADDVRAFPVLLVTGSQHAAEFWEAVRSAATTALDPSTRAQVDKVASYWAALDGQLDAIQVPDSTEASLQAAQTRLGELTAARPAQDVAEQQRLQNLLRTTCGILPNISTTSPS